MHLNTKWSGVCNKFKPNLWFLSAVARFTGIHVYLKWRHCEALTVNACPLCFMCEVWMLVTRNFITLWIRQDKFARSAERMTEKDKNYQLCVWQQIRESQQMETHAWGEWDWCLSKSIGSLTCVESASDKSEQVLCELEDLPFAPFPAAHLCSGGWKAQCKGGLWLQG